jgi:RNA polymerase-binding transcription factor DksA
VAKGTADTASSGSGQRAAAGRTTASTSADKTANKAARKTANKTAAKKTAAKKTAAQKTAAKKTAAKKTAAKKTAAKKTAAKKTAAKKTAAKKTAAKKTATKKTAVDKIAATGTPAKATTTARRTAPKGAATSAAEAGAKRGRRGALAVLPGEKAWTRAEVDEVRGELDAERERLLAEISSAEDDMASLLRDGGEGAGNDQADIGSTALERDAEMSLANNTRDMLFQVDRAKARLADGSYGGCGSCGNPIGKARLMAFPRATLCMSCKQRQERR